MFLCRNEHWTLNIFLLRQCVITVLMEQFQQIAHFFGFQQHTIFFFWCENSGPLWKRKMQHIKWGARALTETSERFYPALSSFAFGRIESTLATPAANFLIVWWFHDICDVTARVNLGWKKREEKIGQSFWIRWKSPKFKQILSLILET